MVVEVSISYTGQAITVCGIDSCAIVWKFNTCQWSIEVVSCCTFETFVSLIIVFNAVRLSSGSRDCGDVLTVIFSMDDIEVLINRTAVSMRDVVVGITHIFFTIKVGNVVVLAGQGRVANVLAKISIRGIIQFPSCLTAHCFVGKFIESVLASLAKGGGCT